MKAILRRFKVNHMHNRNACEQYIADNKPLVIPSTPNPPESVSSQLSEPDFVVEPIDSDLELVDYIPEKYLNEDSPHEDYDMPETPEVKANYYQNPKCT